jgi:hypothetical protein
MPTISAKQHFQFVPPRAEPGLILANRARSCNER